MAAAEVANKEKRLDGSPWGERPVRTVYQFVQMETKLTVEMLRCVAVLIGSGRPAPGIENSVPGLAGGRLGGLVATGGGAFCPAAGLPDAASAPQ